MIEILIDTKQHKIAKYELEKLVETRKNESWKISDKHNKWLSHLMSVEPIDEKVRAQFYNEKKIIAENIVFSDFPLQKAIVEYIDKKRRIVFLITEANQYGKFKYQTLLEKISENDLIEIRLGQKRSNDFYTVYSIVKKKFEVRQGLIKKIEGKVSLSNEYGFAFADGAYISPQLVKSHKLENNQTIKAFATKSFNKKKNEFSWKIVRIFNKAEK